MRCRTAARPAWHSRSPHLLLLLLASAVLLGSCQPGPYLFKPSQKLRGTPAQLGMPYQEIWFPASDGIPIHAWLLPGRRHAPLLLYCHGNAANISARLTELAFFQELGLPILIFDYRGFGQSGGRADSVEGTYRDARGALRYLREQGWAPQQLLYYGRSLGAAVALQLALEEPPAGLVLESAFTALSAIAHRLEPLVYYSGGWWLLRDSYDNLAKISRLQVPLLILHSDADEITPPAMGRALYAAAPPPKTFFLSPGAGHSNAFQVGGSGYRAAWEHFLAGLPLPAPATAAPP